MIWIMQTMLNPTQIAEQGREIYREKIQTLVENEHKGKFLVVDVNSGDYDFDADEEAALQKLELRRPQGLFYLLKIGYASSLFMGGAL